jgi:hypothetical protein
MEYEALRPLALEVLKEQFRQKAILQIVEVISGVETLAVQRGLFESTRRPSPGVEVTLRLPAEDRERVRHILWDLVLEGVVFPGASETETQLNFLKLTPHGRQVLDRGGASPYDPEGYLIYLKREIPNVDPVILDYANEALQTFLKGNLLACSVMIGCASEKAVLLLIDEFIKAVSTARRASVQSSFDSRFSIIKKFEYLRAEFNPIKRQLGRDVADDLDIQLDGVFNLLRNARNDAGHPTGSKVDRNRAFANLQLFVPYCKLIYALLTYFQSNPIP